MDSPTHTHDLRPPAAARAVFANPDTRFAPLVKKIHSGADLARFTSTAAYARIRFLLAFVSACVADVETPTSADGLSDGVSGIVAILSALDALVAAVPPVSGPRRFGNPAYKTWHAAAASTAGPLVEEMLARSGVAQGAAVELSGYLLGALGSPQRLDFGTGHELSFFAFFGACFFSGALTGEGELTGRDVLWTFNCYFALVRRLVKTYTLEPAGSHGVWGLDDHFHLPYIIGAAQLRGTEQRHEAAPLRPPRPPGRTRTDVTEYGMPRPSAVTNREIVESYKDRNMYFGAIAFVYEVKKGPFFEHSPVLYDISGVQSWAKVHSGLIKMYNAEVLGKFPVVQHFGFGETFFPWTYAESPSTPSTHSSAPGSPPGIS